MRFLRSHFGSSILVDNVCAGRVEGNHAEARADARSVLRRRWEFPSSSDKEVAVALVRNLKLIRRENELLVEVPPLLQGEKELLPTLTGLETLHILQQQVRWNTIHSLEEFDDMQKAIRTRITTILLHSLTCMRLTRRTEKPHIGTIALNIIRTRDEVNRTTWT